MLLRCKYSAQKVANAESLAVIEASRKSKDQALRVKGHKFPHFISNQQLIQSYKEDSSRVNPQ